MDKYTIRYQWTLIPGVLFLLLFLPGINPYAIEAYLHTGAAVAWGIVAGVAYIFVFNKIEARRHQYIFLVLSAIALPFIGFGILVGGLLGAIGIIINSGVPLLLLLVLGGWALYKKEGVGRRSIIALVLFILIVSLAVWSLMRVSHKGTMRACANRYLGTWNEVDERCEVSAEQEARNAVFFSGGAIILEDRQVFFDTPNNRKGDLIANVSSGGSLVGTARFRADFALYDDDAGIVFVPILSEISGDLYIASLRAMKNSSGVISRSENISLVNIGSGDIVGWGFADPEERVLDIQVEENGVMRQVLLNVSLGGVLAR